MGHALCPRAREWRMVSKSRIPVGDAAAGDLPAFQFRADQCQFTATLPRDGGIFGGASEQVWHHRLYRPIGHIFYDIIAGPRKIKGNIIAHAEELGKIDPFVVIFQSVFLHLVREK